MNTHDTQHASTFSRKWVNYWFSKRRDGFYGVLIAISFLIYIAGLAAVEYRIGTDWMRLASRLKAAGFASFLITILLILIHRNLNELHLFLKLFDQADHLPKKQIAYVNSFCMTVFLGITFLTTAIISPLLDPVWAAIVAWFKGVFDQIEPEEIPPLEPAVPAGPSMQEVLAMLGGEPKPTPVWLQVAEKILFILGWCLVAVFLFLILRSILRAIWGWITKPRHFDDDEKIYLKPVLFLAGEERPQQETSQRSGRLRQYFSYNNRIRRLYRKEILSRHRKGSQPQQWASPQELETNVNLENPQLHELYEKARYGPSPCTEDDWKTLN